MINPAWPEIAKAAPANLHHHMGHDLSWERGLRRSVDKPAQITESSKYEKQGMK